jgi:hypothetical protein
MKRAASGSWVLLSICLVSLAFYLFFSTALRLWLGGWKYFGALYRGLSALPDPLWMQFWKRVFLPVPWDVRQLIYLGCALAMAFLITIMTWLVLGRRISFVLAIALLVPTCLIVPQTLLAFVFWPDGRGHVTRVLHLAILGFVALVLGIYSLARRSQHSKVTSREPVGSFGLWGIAFVLPVGVVFATALVVTIDSTPGYDAMAYHLPLAAGYGVSNSVLIKEHIPLNYPSNSELLLRWFIFPGNDRLDSLPCFFAALLIAVILFKLCRHLKFERQPALIAACTATAFPLLPFLAVDPNSDLIAIVPMFAALFFLIGLHRTGCEDQTYLGCLGLALGLAAGARFYLLPACAFVMFVALVIILRSRRSNFLSPDSSFNWFWFCRAILTIGFCSLVGGGFWYVRSAVLYGNPFYPISFLGLPGQPLNSINTVVGLMQKKPWLIAVYPWTETDYSIYDTGVGAVFTAIILPGLIWWPASMMRSWKSEKGRCRFERVFLYLFVLFCVLIFVSRPSQFTRQLAFGILLSFFLVAEMWVRVRGQFFRVIVFLSFIVMCFSIEKTLVGSLLYRLALPERECAERFALPAVIDKLPPARVFDAASAYLNYGCMGCDYRHEVLSLDRDPTVEDVREARPDYLLIFEKQKPLFERSLQMELVATAAASNPGESLSLYRLRPR